MPRLTDQHDIRAILRRDPVWGVYALGDLAPAMFAKTLWFTPDLTLVLRDFGTSILFATGPGSVREALDHVTWPVHLQVQRDALDEIARHAHVESERPMWRMGWQGPPDRGCHINPGHAVRLGADDVPALQRLYADGDATGEAPDFFFPSMVTAGAFRGIYEDGALAAAAGTHLLSREEGAAAIGNVYTRRDCRGRGLGRLVTSAVVASLAGIQTVGLNVRADNEPALRLYEALGFVRHCPFYEALATARY
ncbi:MAG: GNAT family N-acetyltransferase [Vicinamibacterales bacterium]|jgi:ribosomal protein S18 acetylase RimI-like enzyme